MLYSPKALIQVEAAAIQVEAVAIRVEKVSMLVTLTGKVNSGG